MDSKQEERHSCISHRYALSSTSPDQQHIATSSKSSATTQQQLQSSPSVNTRPLRCFWTWTSRQTRKGRCYCELPKKATITKAIMCQVKRRMPTTFLVGQSKLYWQDWEQDTTDWTHTSIKSQRWYCELFVHVVRKIRPRSIYSKTVKGMTRINIQIGRLRRHWIRNCMVMRRTSDRQQSASLRLAWPCNSEREEEEDEEEVMYLVHL